MNYKCGYQSVRHEEVRIGSIVYFDNFEDGKFPEADPKISGPFEKIVGAGNGRCFSNNRGSLMHYPENLLVRKQLLNSEELRHWQHHFAEDLLRVGVRVEIDGVTIARDNVGVSFSYKFSKCRGLVFAYSRMSDYEDDTQLYERALRLSPSFSNECRYCPTLNPNLQDIAGAVRKIWADFIS